MRNKTSCPLICRERIVETTFISILDYEDVIYRRTAASTLRPLDSVYHSSLRFIIGNSCNTPHCILYDKVCWSSLTERCNNHWCLYIHKALVGKLPSYITSMLHWKPGPLLIRSSDWLALQLLHARTWKKCF